MSVFHSSNLLGAIGPYPLPSLYCYPVLVISTSFSNTAKFNVGQQLLFNQNRNA